VCQDRHGGEERAWIHSNMENMGNKENKENKSSKEQNGGMEIRRNNMKI
jgi:hypothetical protein